MRAEPVEQGADRCGQSWPVLGREQVNPAQCLVAMNVTGTGLDAMQPGLQAQVEVGECVVQRGEWRAGVGTQGQTLDQVWSVRFRRGDRWTPQCAPDAGGRASLQQQGAVLTLQEQHLR